MIVMIVWDFIFIFDLYIEFEEFIIGVLMEVVLIRVEKGIEDEDVDYEFDIRMMCFEYLMDRWLFFFNDVFFC